MPDAFGFRSARDVKRALKTSRVILDRKRIDGPQWRLSAPHMPTETTETPSTTLCPCGTTYSRGSITSLDPEQGGEHANEYTGSIPFKWGDVDFTIPYSTGSSWIDTGVVVFECDGGDHTVTITLTVCESSHTVCGVRTPQAKMTIVTDANDCSEAEDCGEDDESPCPQEDMSLMYICRNWHPLGTSTFEPVDPQDPTNVVDDCVICVSPKVPTVECVGGEWPRDITVHFNLDTDPFVASLTNIGGCCWQGTTTSPAFSLTQLSIHNHGGGDFSFYWTIIAAGPSYSSAATVGATWDWKNGSLVLTSGSFFKACNLNPSFPFPVDMYGAPIASATI